MLFMLMHHHHTRDLQSYINFQKVGIASVYFLYMALSIQVPVLSDDLL